MPQEIGPQPVPAMHAFDITQDGRHVVWVMQSFEGTRVTFLEVPLIDQLCAAMQDQKAKAIEQQSKIQVPQQVILGPNGEPMHAVPPSDEVLAQQRKLAEENAANLALVEASMEGVPGPDPSESEAGVTEAGESYAKPDTAGDWVEGDPDVRE